MAIPGLGKHRKSCLENGHRHLAIENGAVPLCNRLPEAKRFTIMGFVLIMGGYINGCNYVR